MPAKPTTVKAYLDALPEDRRKAIRAVRTAVNRALPKGYKEGMQYGMIGWFVLMAGTPTATTAARSSPSPSPPSPRRRTTWPST